MEPAFAMESRMRVLLCPYYISRGILPTPLILRPLFPATAVLLAEDLPLEYLPSNGVLGLTYLPLIPA